MNTTITSPSTTQALIDVRQGEIGGTVCNVVDARELHAFLQVGRDFSNWIKDRLAKYGFTEGEDYSPILASRSGDLPGKPRTEYHLTLDTAKELSMVENNEQGRKARRYFIEMEKRALSGATCSTTTVPDYALPGVTWEQRRAIKQLILQRCQEASRRGLTKGAQGSVVKLYWHFRDAFNIVRTEDLEQHRFVEAMAWLAAFDVTKIAEPRLAHKPTPEQLSRIKHKIERVVDALFPFDDLFEELVTRKVLHSAGVKRYEDLNMVQFADVEAYVEDTLRPAAVRSKQLMDSTTWRIKTWLNQPACKDLPPPGAYKPTFSAESYFW